MNTSQKKKPESLRKESAPLLAVELPMNHIRKNLSLKEPAVHLLTSYAAFLSEHHGKTVDEDRVVEGLIDTLKRDRLFTSWMAQQENTERNPV